MQRKKSTWVTVNARVLEIKVLDVTTRFGQIHLVLANYVYNVNQKSTMM